MAKSILTRLQEEIENFIVYFSSEREKMEKAVKESVFDPMYAPRMELTRRLLRMLLLDKPPKERQNSK